MLFNSIHFLIFFPTVVLLYYSIPHRYRWTMLLAASYYFYGSWRVEYLGLIILSTVIDYWAAIRMHSLSTKSERRPYLMLSILVNIGILVAFKYFNFFNDSFRYVSDLVNFPFIIPYLDVLLPVGISFYTFQTMGYSIDVYRGQKEPERHLGIFALYVSFFPQLVAGPIERSRHLLPQFHLEHKFDYEQVASGLRRMMWGFFKKVVIADRLAVYINAAYADPGAQSGETLLLATYFFAFQVYCDFAGYTDIALGSARVMGFKLIENFKRPYFSKSLQELWQRWHISLFSWLRDYIYGPLGGRKKGRFRWYFNILVVFFIAGLWHGADWTFITWGVMSGAFLVMSIATTNIRKIFWSKSEQNAYIPMNSQYKSIIGNDFPISFNRIKILVGIVSTFFFYFLALPAFRANNISDLPIIIKQIFTIDFSKLTFDIGFGVHQIAIDLALIIFLLVVEYYEGRTNYNKWFTRLPVALRWSIYYTAIVVILLFGEFTATEFIYFQF